MASGHEVLADDDEGSAFLSTRTRQAALVMVDSGSFPASSSVLWAITISTSHVTFRLDAGGGRSGASGPHSVSSRDLGNLGLWGETGA